ncbi:DUF5683 domain-containing protein [Odoribacter sp. OttesenSCG-928-A06]|nr:DUF5683 domain-containing protein [Odoribacter sp. OttesenSCG-928-A06]
MNKLLLIVTLLFVFAEVRAVDLQKDTVMTDIPVNETLPSPSLKVAKPHSPHKATIMAMLLPSSGQIYNRQWWKLPILYGGIGATIYGLEWNSRYHNKYRRAFIDYSLYLKEKSENPDLAYPEDASWDELYIRGGVDKFTPNQQDRFKRLLENKKIKYKRDRDLLIIVMAGIYALQIIDACVFAHFYDFEIDEDLSFNLYPTFTPMNGGTIGLSLTINF